MPVDGLQNRGNIHSSIPNDYPSPSQGKSFESHIQNEQASHKPTGDFKASHYQEIHLKKAFDKILNGSQTRPDHFGTTKIKVEENPKQQLAENDIFSFREEVTDAQHQKVSEASDPINQRVKPQNQVEPPLNIETQQSDFNNFKGKTTIPAFVMPVHLLA